MPTQPHWTRPPIAVYDPLQEQHVYLKARHGRGASSIRGALIAGFAVVFALWLISAYELVRNLRDAERRVLEAHETYLRGQEALTGVRTGVLLGSVYFRDALLETADERRQFYRAELDRIHRDVERVIAGYISLTSTPTERSHAEHLQSELDKYWQSREMVFGSDAPATRDGTAELLRSQITPARESVLAILDSMGELQRTARAEHETAVAQMYDEAQHQVMILASISVVVGLIVAFVASGHVGRLERELEQQRRAEQQNRRDLERLSARLVHAQEEERRSLARELHDAVGQALTAIKMEMGVALRGLDGDSRARAALEAARVTAEQTLQSVRDLSQLLHPSTLDDFGLPEALRAHLRSFSTRTGIRTQLLHERMDDRLPADVEVCVYRIVQEALTNVARHSGASACTVSLSQHAGFLHLAIEDDGRGMSAAAPRTPDARRGLGLIGMRERAQALSGTFTFESRTGGGTRLVVRLPVSAAAAPAAPIPQPLAG